VLHVPQAITELGVYSVLGAAPKRRAGLPALCVARKQTRNGSGRPLSLLRASSPIVGDIWEC
jgi:hypothetical protein